MGSRRTRGDRKRIREQWECGVRYSNQTPEADPDSVQTSLEAF